MAQTTDTDSFATALRRLTAGREWPNRICSNSDFNGAWERLVGSVNRALSVGLGRHENTNEIDTKNLQVAGIVLIAANGATRGLWPLTHVTKV